MSRFSLLVIAGAFAFGCGSAEAASLQPVGSFDQPVYVTSSPTNPERLLIVEREGTIAERSAAGTRQLFDLTGLVSCCDVERGMLSIAPVYAQRMVKPAGVASIVIATSGVGIASPVVFDNAEKGRGSYPRPNTTNAS